MRARACVRACVCAYLLQVGFELNQETLELGVKILDHYLSLTPGNDDKLQLIGLTAMFIAAKFEEVKTHTHTVYSFIHSEERIHTIL